ncbi:uncharacterized protein LOC107367911 [Tetranychus urticae]|uniref:Cell cycle checkpoint control protein n=1 Tax=Tetranychus urticae TaxID=32264 RepID=T1KWC0_TETUR|nr:uncharacterized protein LOC107367911 [Tetranychus urticae]
MSLHCKIENAGIKVFAQAINCCCKLGEDVYLDANANELTIKVLNEPYKSAFMMIAFDSAFFDSYEVEGRCSPNDDITNDDGSQNSVNRNNKTPRMYCKLKTRSCLLAFKKEKNLVKNMEHCEINIKSSSDFAQFKFVYDSKCIKKMELPLGCDFLDVNDDVFQNGQNKVTCKAKILADILTYFAKEDEYITMKATPQSIEFETHFADRDKSGKLTKTNIDIDEFELYNISDDIFLTYSLRLIRPFLSFCSGRIPEIDIFMTGSNQPICFNAEYPPYIKIALALATLDVNQSTPNRNSSKSSVMYQTNRSSQHAEATRVSNNNGTRTSRLLSQDSNEISSNPENPRHSIQGSIAIRDQEITNHRLISNEEQHDSVNSLSQGGSPRNISNHSIPPEPIDFDMQVDNLDEEADEICENFPSQSTIGPEGGEPVNSQSQQLSSGQTTKNNSQLTPLVLSQPLPSNLSNGSQLSNLQPRDTSYWMSLEIRSESQLSSSSDELLVPPTDNEYESD